MEYRFEVNKRGKQVEMVLNQRQANSAGDRLLYLVTRREDRHYGENGRKCPGVLERKVIPTRIGLEEVAGERGVEVRPVVEEGIVRARCTVCKQGFEFNWKKGKWTRLSGI